MSSDSMTTPSVWDGARLLVKPKAAWKLLACSNTRGYELLNAGELESFLDGRSRKITVASIYNYIARHLAPTVDPQNDSRLRRRGRRRKSPTPEATP